MDGKLVRLITDHIVQSNNQNTLEFVSEALIGGFGNVIGVKDARDQFTQVLRSARAGNIQVIGLDPEEQIIIITTKDLTEMVEYVCENQSYVDSLLSDPSYKPLNVSFSLPELPLPEEVLSFGLDAASTMIEHDEDDQPQFGI